MAETIFVIDDEADIPAVARDMLESLGYTVLERQPLLRADP